MICFGYLCIYFSKHHQSFDPFEEQKQTSFKEYEDSAVSLAEFLCRAMETSFVSGNDGCSVKNAFDTLLQVPSEAFI